MVSPAFGHFGRGGAGQGWGAPAHTAQGDCELAVLAARISLLVPDPPGVVPQPLEHTPNKCKINHLDASDIGMARRRNTPPS